MNKLTKDEILNMEAGPEADERIAQLMGAKWQSDGTLRFSVDGPKLAELKYAHRTDKPGKFREFVRYYGPNYTEDIAATWMVVEKLGIAIIPQSAEGGFNWLAMDLEKVVYAGDIALVEKNGSAVSAETAPLAICRAALLAVMETEQP